MNVEQKLGEFQTLIDKYSKEFVFSGYVMSLYMDEPLNDDFISSYVTDGSEDKKTDFLALVETEEGLKKIYLAQSSLSEKDKSSAKSNKAADLNIAISWMFSGNRDKIPPKLKGLMDDCLDAINNHQVVEFHVLYTHNLPSSVSVAVELDTIKKDLESRLNNLNVKVIAKEIGIVELEKLVNQKGTNMRITDDIVIPFAWYSHQSGNDWDATITVIDGAWLKQIYHKYGEDLFSNNYRGFLGANARKKINNKIKNTAENETKDFWAYNNGITILTNAMKKDRKDQLKISGISIINGAQTTGCIGNLKDKINFEDIKILTKVIKCDDATKASDIVKYSNTQNVITTWDRYSNDHLQHLIQKQLGEFNVQYSLKRGSEASPAEIGIESIVQPLLAFRGKYDEAEKGKNIIFDNKSMYDNAFNSASGRHIIFVNSISTCFDEYRYNEKQTPEENLIDRTRQRINLISEIGYKTFYMYMFGRMIQDISNKQLDQKSVCFDTQYLKDYTIKELAAKLYKLTEKLNMVISNSFYTINKKGVKFKELTRDKEKFEEWQNSIMSLMSISLDSVDNIEELRVHIVNG